MILSTLSNLLLYENKELDLNGPFYFRIFIYLSFFVNWLLKLRLNYYTVFYCNNMNNSK